jgi:hypothetical protein
MQPLSLGERTALAEKILSTKQQVAESVTEEFSVFIRTRSHAMAKAGGNSGSRTRRIIGAIWPPSFKLDQPPRSQTMPAGQSACSGPERSPPMM